MVADKMKNSPKSWVGGSALILVLTVVAYVPAMRGGFIWDDDLYVTENQTLRSLDGLRKIWFEPGTTAQYYPLVFTSFWVEYHLWKANPFGYHLVNVALHAVNAVLLWSVLRRLDISGAWWAAAIFALHPVAVESVAWTTERKNVLSGLFYLLSTLAYLRFRPLTGQSRDLDWRSYSLVLGLFLAALLSKTVTCTLPVVLVLTTWWKQGRVEKRDALVLAPLFVLGAGLGLVTVWMEKRHVGAAGAEWSLSFIQRCLLAGRAVWFYAGKLVWPANLTFIYPRWEIDATVLWQYFFPLAGFGLLIVMWWVRGKIGRGPLVAALIFVVGLGPALGFVDVYPFRYSFVADHFQYLACIGLIVLITGISATILQQVGRWGHDLGSGAGVAVLAGLGFLTWQQTHIYRDVETLWRDTLRKNPQAWMAHDNLAIELTKAGRLNEAIQHFQYTLNVRPNDEDAHYNFGLALWQQGLKQEAMEHWRHALEIKPDFPEVHNNLGVALMETGLLEESIDHYHQALRLRPNDANAHYNLGVALWRSSRFQEAIQSYQRALQIDPDYAEARYNLGTTLEQTGRLLEAIEHYEQILRLNPNSPELRKRVERLRAAQ